MTVPNSTPKMTRAEVMAKIAAKHPDFIPGNFLIVGIRGYYQDTMGKPDVNDRSIYDDAIFIVSENEFHAFNANCDPSRYRPDIASLVPGIWPAYRFDIHGGKSAQYPAICQRADEVTVMRDGSGEDTGMFGINIHKGGYHGTSSLGCQTIYPDQWDRFYKTAERIFKGIHGDRWKKETITYILLEQ